MLYDFVYLSVGANEEQSQGSWNSMAASNCGRGTLPVVCFGGGLLGKNTLLSNLSNIKRQKRNKCNKRNMISRFRAEHNHATQTIETMLPFEKWSLMVVVVDLLRAF